LDHILCIGLGFLMMLVVVGQVLITILVTEVANVLVVIELQLRVHFCGILGAVSGKVYELDKYTNHGIIGTYHDCYVIPLTNFS